jgi:mono/diheme cytochrome c family protein
MGRLTGTAPFGWTGKGEKLIEHMEKTFSRLGGKGLPEHQLAALLSYIASLEPPHPELAGASLRERGQEVFFSHEAGCSSCHSGEAFTDGMSHDVTSAATGDKTKAFDTPSLLYVGASAPYFHDGRFATLRDMLDSTSGMMGKTSHLSDADKDALVTYLRTL